MKHILFAPGTDKLKTAIIIKEAALRKPGILANYINPLTAAGVEPNTLVAVDLKYQANNKCTAAHAKDYLSVLLPALDRINITTILCADGIYFKYLTKNAKVEPFHGEVMPCAIKGFEHINVILSVNFQAMEYNPAVKTKLDLSIDTLAGYLNGSHIELGSDIIHTESYPRLPEEIKVTLDWLMDKPELTCDIETRSLNFWEAGIESIAFAWNKHEGISFCIDRDNDKINNKLIRVAVKEFLTSYKGTLIWHNISYDAKILVYELWMQDLQDYKGMLKGIEIMTQNFDDTKLITFLSTNNAVRNILDLKSLSQEYMGNYGVL